MSSLLLTGLEQEIRRQTKDPNAHLADCFDLIAGTSVGGIIAALLTLPDWKKPDSPRYSAAETHELLLQHLPQAFTNVRNRGGTGLLSEKYDGRSLEMMLRAVFGRSRLSALVRPTLITAYDLDIQQALFFCSHDYYSAARLAQEGLNPSAMDTKPQWALRDVCRATSAAPIVFKSAAISPIGDKSATHTMLDGGIFASNPSLCAYAEVRAKWQNSPGVIDMLTVSVGTGYGKTEIRTGGYLTGWGRGLQLIDLLMNSSNEAADFQMERIYSDSAVGQRQGSGSYWRFNWPLQQPVSLDKADRDTVNSLLCATGDSSSNDDRDWHGAGAQAADWLNRKDRTRLQQLAKLLLH